jgi:CSLREA domain-containing protein
MKTSVFKLFISALHYLGVSLLLIGLIGNYQAAAAAPGAPTYTVTVTTDSLTVLDDCAAGHQCSLRAAIQAANNYGPGATVQLPIGVYTLTLAGAGDDNNLTGDLDITQSMTISGSSEQAIIDGNHLDRVFDIHNQAGVTFSNLTIRNGKAPDAAAGSGGSGQDGGGIRADGALTLNYVSLTQNASGNGSAPGSAGNGGEGGRGGAIYSEGTLTLTNVTLVSNTSGHGGNGFQTGAGGKGGNGAAIYTTGDLTYDNTNCLVTETCLVDLNQTGNGGTGGALVSSAPNASSGGAGGSGIIYVENKNAAFINVIMQNGQTGSGGNGGLGGSFGNGGPGGQGGSGAAVYFSGPSGTLSLENVTLQLNTSGDGGDGGNGLNGGTGGAAGNGGAVWSNGTVIITFSLVDGNTTGTGGLGGDTTAAGSGGVGGNGGNGAGVYSQGPLTILKSTLSNNITGNAVANAAAGSGGGIYQNGSFTLHKSTLTGNQLGTSNGSGAAPLGGAVYNASGNLDLANSTLSGNNAGAGKGGGIAINSGSVTLAFATVVNNSAAEGGGVYSVPTYTLLNSVLSGNNATLNPDCSSSSTAASYSLVKAPAGCNLTGSNNLTGQDPQLGALSNNGGPTQTHVPQKTSPALDAIPVGVSGCGTTYTDDQRSANRGDSKCDLGALERGTPASLSVVAGNSQSTIRTMAFATPLKVQLLDTVGAALDGEPVTFSGPLSGAGVVLPAGGQTTTALDGTAQIQAAANDVAGGPYTVTASSGNLTSAFSLTNNKAPVTLLLTTHAPDPAIAGQVITVSFQLSSFYSGTPGGTVSILEGELSPRLVCTVDAAKPACPLILDSRGTKKFQAVYSGDARFLGANSNTVLHLVNRGGPFWRFFPFIQP